MAIVKDRFTINEDLKLNVGDYFNIDKDPIEREPVNQENTNAESTLQRTVTKEKDSKKPEGFAYFNKYKKALRETKDLKKNVLTEISEAEGIVTKQLDKQIENAFKNTPLAGNALLTLGDKCKNRLGGNHNSGRSLDYRVECGGNTHNLKGGSDGSNCKPGDLNSSLGALTGSKLPLSVSDLNSLFNKLVGLTKLGYDLKVCGVFEKLVTGLEITDKTLLSKAAAVIASDSINVKDAWGLIDIASQSKTLNTLLQYPDIVPDALKNITIPENIKEIGRGSFYGKISSSVASFDPNWKKGFLKGELMNHGVKNNSFFDLVQAKVSENSFSASQLDIIPNEDDLFLLASIA